ncbi:FAD-binding oxidoreductase [Agromyces sp. MMS24-JH15]|uniref:FAD-binding oxidoreductase n=1 Tax=Agromyces sp. MMS24-JH15 TaxID=3243765 RepID=UPI00374A790B
MTGTAVSGAGTTAARGVPRARPAWHVATVSSARMESPTARRIVLDVPTWPGNAAGQHLDLRLTAPDGYTATRSYSIASAGDGTRVTLAVDRLPDGEVSPFLVDDLREGDLLEVHGPLGRYFIWEPSAADGRPVQLIAGGSGVVPLVAIAQAHADAGHPAPMRLLYSVRTPEDVLFADALTGFGEADAPFRLDLVYTRRAPEGWPVPAGRIDRRVLGASVLPVDSRPIVYVCGSTGFVERVADWLIALGHAPGDIRTERFGGTA